MPFFHNVLCVTTQYTGSELLNRTDLMLQIYKENSVGAQRLWTVSGVNMEEGIYQDMIDC